MAIQGSLKTITIPDLFSLLHQLRKTGILSLVSEQDERSFLFYQGDLIFATTKDGSQQLGTFLVRLGILSSDELTQALANSEDAEIYLGDRLVEAGRISRNDLSAAVQEQIMELTEEVLTWSSGAFHFDNNELPFVIPDGSPVSTHSIILEAARRTDEKNRIRQFFPDLDVVLAPNDERMVESGNAEKDSIVELADGRRTIEQILFSSSLGEQTAAEVLHELFSDQVVHQVGVQVQGGGSRAVPELHCLPVAPDVPGKLFSVFNTEDDQMNQIARIVSQDPMLTAKVLKILTLGGVELSRESLSIGRFAERIGSFRLRSILIPEAIRGLFFARTDCFWKECWEHSILCAQLSRKISTWVDHPYPEEAYLCGLLHNMGLFILMQHDPAAYRRVVSRSLREEQDVEELEEEFFGISHTKLGGIYAEKWNFPKSILSAIKMHHQVEGNTQNQLANILSVARGIAKESGVGIGYVPASASQFRLALKRLHLPRKKVMGLMDRKLRQVSSVSA